LKRRTALVTIGLTALRGVAWSLTRPRLALAKLGQAEPAASTQEIDNRLRDDMTRRKQRVNSEEGIAMFLVCENLVPDGSTPALTPENAVLAAEFQETAAAWERVYPGAEYGDVAHVIEVMAARDFAHGGTGGAQ
jgi:hypothetical protein